MDCGLKKLCLHVLFVFILLSPSIVSAIDLCPACCDPSDPFTCFGDPDCDDCCIVCDRTIKFVWPVRGVQLAENPLKSVCDGGTIPFHYGYDFYVPDNDPVYAAFDGTAYRFNETGLPGYNLGCAVELRSSEQTPGGDPKMIAYYGHLLEEGMAFDQEEIEAGAIIGKAGGGQENADCRGSSTGARLYFELVDRTRGYLYVDPHTCAVNTCKFWYTLDALGNDDCTPNLNNEGDCWITPMDKGGQLVVKVPSYSCYMNDQYNRYYAEVTINPAGRLNLSCYGTGEHRRCMSEIYGLDPAMDLQGDAVPLIATGAVEKTELNCFLRFIRVHGDGTYTCGEIVGAGESADVDWEVGDCDLLAALGIEQQSKSRNVGYLQLQPITITADMDLYNQFVVVSNEYQILGIDDSDYVDKSEPRRQITKTNFLDPAVFSRNRDDYWMDYTLVRICDLAGTVQISDECKRVKITGMEGTGLDYDEIIDGGAFISCEFNILDAGKYYDYPDMYIDEFGRSRMGANRGELYYQ